jgi:hypothetical protein
MRIVLCAIAGADFNKDTVFTVLQPGEDILDDPVLVALRVRLEAKSGGVCWHLRPHRLLQPIELGMEGGLSEQLAVCSRPDAGAENNLLPGLREATKR